MNDRRPVNLIAPTAQNTCGVFVTYNPEPSLARNLSSVVHQVSRVTLVDNASKDSVAQWIVPEIRDRVEVIQNAKNLGIATALNRGIQRARELGYHWVLTMDQDTEAHPNLMAGLRAVYDDYPARECIGTLAANFIDLNRGRLFAGAMSAGNSYIEQAVAITAGSLVPIPALDDAGDFRDDFFIDFVDHEFSLRLRSRGWRIVYSREPLIEHSIGAPVRHHFLWMRPTTSNHSALRRYYITRNRLLTAAEFYDTEPRAVITDLWRVAGEAAAVLAFEPDRVAKFWAMVTGATDAILGRGGPRKSR